MIQYYSLPRFKTSIILENILQDILQDNALFLQTVLQHSYKLLAKNESKLQEICKESTKIFACFN